MIVLRGGGNDEPPAEAGSGQESAVVVLDGGGDGDRPRVRLEHPAGAVAEVPGGPVVYGTGVDLKRVEMPDTSPAWDRGGTAWRFESVGGITISETIAVELPATGRADEAVIALTQLGAWIELTSEQTTLGNGKPGRRFEVKDVPAPWIVAVAVPVKGFAGASIENDAVRLERLYWTDRAAWQAEVEAWLPDAEPESVLADRPTGYASLLVQSRTPSDFAIDLEKALLLLGGARVAMVGSGATLAGGAFTASLPGTGLTGFQLYIAGIDRLAQLRAEWVLAWKRWENEGIPRGEMLFDSSGTTVEQALESALYAWAPWGVDFTRWLVRTGTLPAFDLRVLRPYGEIYFTDVLLTGSGSQSHPEMEAAITAASEPFAAGSVKVTRYLRLYSTWSIESTSWIDTLRSWKENIDTWLERWEVAASAVGLLAGTVTPVGFAVTAGLYASGGVDALVEYLSDTYAEPGDGQAWAQFEVFGSEIGAGIGTPLALGWVEKKSTSFHSLLTNEEDAVFEFGTKDIISTMIDVSLTVAAINSDWYMLKDVRAISAGTQGYCPAGDCGVLSSTAIPPIQALAIVEGTLKPEDRDAYPASGSRLLAWDMQYVGDAKPNLHELFHSDYDLRQDSEWSAVRALSLNQPKKGAWTGSLSDLPFEPHKPETGPVSLSYAYRSQPHMQAIRLAIPNATLKTIASEYKLGSSPEFKDYGLRLVVTAADGTRNVFPLEEVAGPRAGDKKETTYVTVQLTRDEFEPEDEVLESLPDGYAGARQRMEEGILRTKLTVTIRALADQTDRLTYAIDFLKAPARLVQADPETPGSPRVHLYDASGVEGAALFVGMTSDDRPIEILVDFAKKTWQVQRWGIAAHTVKLPSGGTCSNEEAVIGLAPDVAKQYDSELAKTLASYWLSGVLVENRLTRGPLPDAWEGEEIPAYVHEDFGTLNASRTAISDDKLEVWFSNIMGCPLDVVSYTATRQ